MTAPYEVTYEDERHKYAINADPAPSVTQVLGLLDKPALPWWGMRMGVEGILKLRELGAEVPWDDADGAVKLLTEHRLTVNHVRDSAATRGKSVHTALERYAATGGLPDLSEFPMEDRGFVQGVARAMLELQPEFVTTEQIVASKQHHFAGRYDFKAWVRWNGERVLALGDLKTGKGIYPSHMLQLSAYSLADQEMGNAATDVQLAVGVRADGEFEIVESWSIPEDFVAVKRAYDALQRMKARKPRAPRKQKVAA